MFLRGVFSKRLNVSDSLGKAIFACLACACFYFVFVMCFDHVCMIKRDALKYVRKAGSGLCFGNAGLDKYRMEMNMKETMIPRLRVIVRQRKWCFTSFCFFLVT